MRVSLKDELLLTADKAFAKAQKVATEEKAAVGKTKSVKKPKNGGKRGRKRKAKEIESDADDNSSNVGSDSVLPPEIFDCIMVSERL